MKCSSDLSLTSVERGSWGASRGDQELFSISPDIGVLALRRTSTIDAFVLILLVAIVAVIVRIPERKGKGALESLSEPGAS